MRLNLRARNLQILVIVAYGLIASAIPSVLLAQSKPENVRQVLAQKLPNMNGNNLKITIVEVNYAPGAASVCHTHGCPVVVYVEEGRIRSQVRGQSNQSRGTGTYKAGAAFYEPPHEIHAVSSNDSASRTARFLAIFVCDREVPLTVPIGGEDKRGSK